MEAHNIDTLIEDFDILGIKDSIDFDIDVDDAGIKNLGLILFNEQQEYLSLLEWNKKHKIKIVGVFGYLAGEFVQPEAPLTRSYNPHAISSKWTVAPKGSLSILFSSGEIIYFVKSTGTEKSSPVSYQTERDKKTTTYNMEDPGLDYLSSKNIFMRMLTFFESKFPVEYKRIKYGE